MSWSTSELRVRLARRETGLSPPVKIFLLTFPRQYFICRSSVLFMACICHAFAFVNCCPVVTWRERADLLALVCDVYCDFVTLSFGILRQVWYLIVSIPDPCCLSNFLYVDAYQIFQLLFWMLLCTFCFVVGKIIYVLLPYFLNWANGVQLSYMDVRNKDCVLPHGCQE